MLAPSHISQSPGQLRPPRPPPWTHTDTSHSSILAGLEIAVAPGQNLGDKNVRRPLPPLALRGGAPTPLNSPTSFVDKDLPEVPPVVLPPTSTASATVAPYDPSKTLLRVLEARRAQTFPMASIQAPAVPAISPRSPARFSWMPDSPAERETQFGSFDSAANASVDTSQFDSSATTAMDPQSPVSDRFSHDLKLGGSITHRPASLDMASEMLVPPPLAPSPLLRENGRGVSKQSTHLRTSSLGVPTAPALRTPTYGNSNKIKQLTGYDLSSPASPSVAHTQFPPWVKPLKHAASDSSLCDLGRDYGRRPSYPDSVDSWESRELQGLVPNLRMAPTSGQSYEQRNIITYSNNRRQPPPPASVDEVDDVIGRYTHWGSWGNVPKASEALVTLVQPTTSQGRRRRSVLDLSDQEVAISAPTENQDSTRSGMRSMGTNTTQAGFGDARNLNSDEGRGYTADKYTVQAPSPSQPPSSPHPRTQVPKGHPFKASSIDISARSQTRADSVTVSGSEMSPKFRPYQQLRVPRSTPSPLARSPSKKPLQTTEETIPSRGDIWRDLYEPPQTPRRILTHARSQSDNLGMPHKNIRAATSTADLVIASRPLSPHDQEYTRGPILPNPDISLPATPRDPHHSMISRFSSDDEDGEELRQIRSIVSERWSPPRWQAKAGVKISTSAHRKQISDPIPHSGLKGLRDSVMDTVRQIGSRSKSDGNSPISPMSSPSPRNAFSATAERGAYISSPLQLSTSPQSPVPPQRPVRPDVVDQKTPNTYTLPSSNPSQMEEKGMTSETRRSYMRKLKTAFVLSANRQLSPEALYPANDEASPEHAPLPWNDIPTQPAKKWRRPSGYPVTQPSAGSKVKDMLGGVGAKMNVVQAVKERERKREEVEEAKRQALRARIRVVGLGENAGATGIRSRNSNSWL